MISKQQVDRYHEEGAIVVEGVLDSQTCREMNAVLRDLIEKSRSVTTHNDIYDLEPGHSSAEPRVRRIKKPHLVHPLFDQVMRSPRLLSHVQALLGENLRLYGTKLNLKSPRYGSPVEWHQDWAFYPHTNDDVLAVGVMLDDTTVENGAMYCLPGSHMGPTYDHHDKDGFFCGSMDPETCGVDFSTAVACEGPAGSCSFHHVRTIHGSAMNLSDRSRGLLLYEIAAADAFPLLGITDYQEYKRRMLIGEDSVETRLSDAPVRLPYPPARFQGSIYENQTTGKTYFGRANQR